MIDYSIAANWADVVHAIAIIESNENPAQTGDGGRAFGVMQQHPAFFQEYYGRCKDFPASVTDTWVEAQIKAAASFFELWEHLGLDLCVMAYNLGINAVMNGARNPGYLARFSDALNRVRAKKSA